LSLAQLIFFGSRHQLAMLCMFAFAVCRFIVRVLFKLILLLKV
jgi:hypothetical protein